MQADLARYTLSELVDAASHVDRERFPDRAAEFDSEIRVRRAAGDQVPWSIRGGASWGRKFMEWTVKWPAAQLSFTDRYIALSVPTLTTAGEFRLERDEVTVIRERNGWFTRGFEIVHEKASVPETLLFRVVWDFSKTREALLQRGWVVEYHARLRAAPPN